MVQLNELTTYRICEKYSNTLKLQEEVGNICIKSAS